MSKTLSITVDDEQLARAQRLAAARGITVEKCSSVSFASFRNPR